MPCSIQNISIFSFRQNFSRMVNRQICMDEQVYFDLKEGLINRLKAINQIEHDPWITANEALSLLSINSQTTLKKFCDQGHIPGLENYRKNRPVRPPIHSRFFRKPRQNHRKMKDIELIKKGFNAGYLLQKHDPELAQKLLKGLKDKDIPYAQGYKAGIKEYTREQIKEHYKAKSTERKQNRELGRDR